MVILGDEQPNFSPTSYIGYPSCYIKWKGLTQIYMIYGLVCKNSSNTMTSDIIFEVGWVKKSMKFSKIDL